MAGEVAAEEKIIRSNRRGCHGGGGVPVTVKNDRMDKIEGDPKE